jgi:signal transduction histidine kinase
MSDSTQSTIFNEQIASNIQNLEAQFKSSQQLAQIQQLEEQANRNRIFILSLVAAFFAVITIVVLVYRTYSQRKKILDRDSLLQQSRIEQLEKEKQLLASEAIIRGQEEERTRMAKDLHDGLGGMLSGVKFSLTNMKVNTILDADSTLVFERALDMLDHSIQELRRVAHNMMPEVLINFGLSEAVRGYCESIQQTKLITIEFNSIGMTERVSKEVEIQSFRIIQELLNNVLRHANAQQVVVQLSKHDDHLFITVEDDGKGFDVAVMSDKNSAGLANIRNRLNLLKGTMEIDSTPDKGTSVEINIALK